MTFKTLFLLHAFVVASMGLCLGNAFAQTDGADETDVTTNLSITQEFDSNIYNSQLNAKHSFITRINPSVKITAIDTKPDSLVFMAGVNQAIYTADKDDNFLNYNLGAKAKRALTDNVTLDGRIGARKLHATRGDDDANPEGDASEPLPFYEYKAETSLHAVFGDWSFKPRLGYTKFDFENVRRINGTLIDQGFRDRDEYVVGGRVAYDLGRAYAVFADIDYNPRQYDDSSSSKRSSDGGRYTLGVRYEPYKGTFAEIYTGYLTRSYDMDVYDDIHTFDAGAKLAWTYAEKSKLVASVTRRINEVTDANVGGAVATVYSISVSKQMAPDLTGTLKFGYNIADYQGGNGALGGLTDRKDNTYDTSMSLDYALNNNVSLLGGYTYINKDSNNVTSNFYKSVVKAGVKVDF